MIIDFSIENYKSIKEKVTFSLGAEGSNKLPKNLIKQNSLKLVRSSAIYGSNASGKSNLIEGLFFMWNMVINSHTYTVNTKIPRTPYKFNESSVKGPSSFEVNFIHGNVKYCYGFACTEEVVIEEYLYYWPKGNKSLIFKRSKNEFDFKKDRDLQELFKKQTTPNVLYVSRATQLGYEKTKQVYDFFANYLVININPMWHEFTIKSISENKELKKKILGILRGADFGGIDDIGVKKEKAKVKQITFDGSAISEKEEEKEVYNVEFFHKVDGKSIRLSLTEESVGTQKMLDMLGPIFDILENGKVAVIDEIESSLHPRIVKFIVKLFSSRHNLNNAQLIFSTHNTSLLDNELFRKDQIYFCEKEPNKSTKLISLTEFDIRQDANFEKAYNEGRFGASPFVDETYTD